MYAKPSAVSKAFTIGAPRRKPSEAKPPEVCVRCGAPVYAHSLFCPPCLFRALPKPQEDHHDR